jgi:predicted nucleic acid-binding protein
MGQQRGLLDATRRKTITGFLRDLPIRVDDATTEQAWVATATLAARHRLTVYDPAYLELAHRLALPLATLDQELRNAAVALGVALLGASTDPVDF